MSNVIKTFLGSLLVSGALGVGLDLSPLCSGALAGGLYLLALGGD
mgnify:CR=1 FL=1